MRKVSRQQGLDLASDSSGTVFKFIGSYPTGNDVVCVHLHHGNRHMRSFYMHNY